MISTLTLETAGQNEFKIPVSISYRIIELFSAGLYSSPNKAIEELVANSYDAMATNVNIVVPTSLVTGDPIIWVIDDGTSMDAEGLVDLWRIASSKKRTPGKESTDRPPVGKFGIGKLATYVLAKHLTYVCKSKAAYRAVTMDFTKVDQNKDADTVINLDVRKLSEGDASTLLAPIVQRNDEGSRAIKLFGDNSAESWTVAAMGNLKPLAQKVTHGRLRWVLSTALPLSPTFNLFFNGERLNSSREKLEPLKEWKIGEDDSVAAKLKFATVSGPGIEIEGLGRVKGGTQIFEDFLTGGKAADWGRSHGIFVMVRGRLVNLDDALFGLPQLSHGIFARFRMEVYADGLDDVLRSTRETVLESEGVGLLREYILAKFNEARSWYEDWRSAEDKRTSISSRVGNTPQSLSRLPLINALQAIGDGSVQELFLVRPPAISTPELKAAFVTALEEAQQGDLELIQQVELKAIGIDAGMALYDFESKTILVNILHPFYANYHEHYNDPEPFKLLAVTEVLTETYLLETALSPGDASDVMRRRDRFLRELVYSQQLAAPLVAEFLRESATKANELERAVAAGLSSLGFDVSPLGGKGRPDGLAYARLGYAAEDAPTKADYLITWDSKSSGKDRIQAHTVGAAGIARHRRDYGANYSLVVAPGFANPNDETGALLKEARSENVTLMTIEDFTELILVAATRQLGFSKLRSLFETCRSPREAEEWIRKVANEDISGGPLPEILEAIWQLQKDSIDPVKFAAVKMQDPRLKQYREREIREWMEAVRRLAGGYVTIQGDVVRLEINPEKILRTIRRLSTKLPVRLQHQGMIQSLVAEPESEDPRS